MCSIFGAFAVGRSVDCERLARIRERCRDRGRDGGRMELYGADDWSAALGAWRATPTTETAAAPAQPYDGIVHNGTIANDLELGNAEDAVDSMILPAVLDRFSVASFARSLARVVGSYAIAVLGDDRVLLAANYKPIHYAAIDGAVYFASMERHLAPELPFGVRCARLTPYTALDLRTGAAIALERNRSKGVVVIASSGLDSTTAAYKLAADGHEVTLLHFDYGCRAGAQELARVQMIAKRLGARCVVLPLNYRYAAAASVLLNEESQIAPDIAGAEFAHEWVPARNLVMIANAVAYAEANGLGAVALGNNLEEAGAFPDNEEQFTTLLDAALDYAVHDGAEVRLLSPLGHLMKHEIVAEGLRLGVPYELTWSCYRGGERHCGACGPCFMRRVAFERNGARDPAFFRAEAA